MISVNNISVSFGGFALFENVSFLVNGNDRIGLAGKNGSGKSTMLKLLSGLQSPTTGTIGKPNGLKIAYLPQDMVHQHGKTVFEEAATAFIEMQQLEARLVEVNHQLETRTDYETDSYSNLITEVTDITHRLDILGSGNRDEEIEKKLKGLGFDRSEFNRPTSELSGGWRMRIELVKLLLQKPDVLLLDEPTNHLDIESMQWLEEFMETFPGALVLISHDKKFLDNVTTRTIEISNHKIYDYKTNYSHYLTLRKERREQQESAAKNQQKVIAKTQVLIDKYRAKASKAAFAQSLIKQLDKMDIIEVDDDDSASIHFRFPPPAHSGKIALTVENAGKAYGPKRIFSGANFIIEKGERIAFVGRNGEGKTTMMKMISGQTEAEGVVKLGHNVLMGYFEQDQAEKLDSNKTVFDTIDELAVGEIRARVRNLLGAFLFSGEDVDKKVKVLSGGERGRLALCKLLLQPYNVLMLDEPTNHLDIRSKDILKRALLNYEGTLIIVSHDRDFLEGLVHKLYEFRDGHVKEHLCDINEFMRKRKLERLNETRIFIEEKKVEKAVAKGQNNLNEEAKKVKQLENKILKTEDEIAELEKKISEAEKVINQPDFYETNKDSSKVLAEYQTLKTKLEEKFKVWEGYSEELNKITA
ncbi:MAG TPA: ATP-binding cassette domain-containing protein [Bacteroidia bacterium]|jgi:ATP-binding cassette subfamily F protein 3|nr:ATP-binding cassette domain-containing protein [Bacteroidia bacterium]